MDGKPLEKCWDDFIQFVPMLARLSKGNGVYNLCRLAFYLGAESSHRLVVSRLDQWRQDADKIQDLEAELDSFLETLKESEQCKQLPRLSGLWPE